MRINTKSMTRLITIITAFVITGIPGITASISFEELSDISTSFHDSLKFEDFHPGGSFQENQGQWKNDAEYVSTTQFGHIAFDDLGIIYDLKTTANGEDGNIIRIDPFNGYSGRPRGYDQVSGRSNYIRGIDPDSWLTGVKSYRGIFYDNLWNGIDLQYYYSEEGPKYQFILEPYADHSDISMMISGHEWLEIEDDSIVIGLNDGRCIMDTGLTAYSADDSKYPVDVEFVLIDDNKVGFSVGVYDKSERLIIDPLLRYSTFIGGSGGENFGQMISDENGCPYIVGSTYSSDFPTTPGAYNRTYVYSEVFVAKMNSTLSGLIFSTFIGGSSLDYGSAIAIDDNGDVYISGQTNSRDFPVTAGAYDTTYNDSYYNQMDLFIAKMNNNGSKLIYSTYFGNKNRESVVDIHADSNGNAVLAITAAWGEIPVTSGAYDETYNGGMDDLAVIKLNANGSSLLYSTYIGGIGYDAAADSRLADDGLLYITGTTNSTDFPTTQGSYDPTFNQASKKGYGNPYILGFNLSRGNIQFSTFFGIGYGMGIALDNDGYIYGSGGTTSVNIATTEDAYQDTLKGKIDSFVYKLNQNASALLYSTYIGGSNSDFIHAMDVNSTGCAFVFGLTYSVDFPTTKGAYDQTLSGNDAFITTVNKDGSGLLSSTYLGGIGWEYPRSIFIHPDNHAVVGGGTASSNFPTTNGSFITKFPGITGLFISSMNCSRVLMPPSAPSNLTGKMINDEVVLEWEKPKDDGGTAVISYEIYRGNLTSPETQIVSTKNLSYIDMDIDESLEYFYYVKAKNSAGLSSRSGSIWIMESICPSINEDLTTPYAVPGMRFTFSVDVTDNVEVAESNVRFILGGNPMLNRSMVRADGDIWEYTIDIPDHHMTILYSFHTSDTKGNNAATKWMSRNVTGSYLPVFAEDLTPKSIGAGSIIDFSAVILDNWGISETCIEYWIENRSSINASMVGSKGDIYHLEASIPGIPGEHLNYIFHAQDVHGNWNETLERSILLKDNSIPKLIYDRTANQGTTGDPFIFRASVSDDFGIETVDVWISIGEGDPKIHSMTTISGNTWTYHMMLPHTTQNIRYQFIITDISGNINNTDKGTVMIIDNDMPMLINDTSQDRAYTAQIFSFDGVVFDNVGISAVAVNYMFDSGPERITDLTVDSGMCSAEIEIPEEFTGEMEYFFTISDTSGNRFISRPSIVDIIDATPPKIDQIDDITVYPGEPITVKLNTSDNDRVHICTWTGVIGTHTGFEWSGSISNPGLHEIDITAADRAGNSDSISFKIIVLSLLLDSDSDGLPDIYEMENGLSISDPSDASDDPDEDGLTNLNEYHIGTFIRRSDSDNDGMPDGWEDGFGLDPLASSGFNDTDLDGRLDLEEYLLGTDPTVPEIFEEEEESRGNGGYDLAVVILALLSIVGLGTLLYLMFRRRSEMH